MKFFLSVYFHDYQKSYKDVKSTSDSPEPDALELERLKQYFRKVVWFDDQKERWLPFVSLVQRRRNAIHAYKHREIGTLEEFHEAIRSYHKFLDELECQLPPQPDPSDYG